MSVPYREPGEMDDYVKAKKPGYAMPTVLTSALCAACLALGFASDHGYVGTGLGIAAILVLGIAAVGVISNWVLASNAVDKWEKSQ